MDAKLIKDLKVELLILKYIPLTVAILQFLSIIMQFFWTYNILIGVLGGIGFIPLIFLYISSYKFKFCLYHRIPLYYATIVQLLGLFDVYIGIPVSLMTLFVIHIILFICLILSMIYFKYGTIKRFSCRRQRKI